MLHRVILNALYRYSAVVCAQETHSNSLRYPCIQCTYPYGLDVGPISCVLLFFEFFRVIKKLVTYWVSLSYLTDVTVTHVKYESDLTHWGRVTHICVGKLTIIGSDKGLSPDRRQAIIWTNAGILLIEPLLGTNFSEIAIEIQTFSFKKKYLKVSSAKWRPFCLGLNVLSIVPADGQAPVGGFDFYEVQ